MVYKTVSVIYVCLYIADRVMHNVTILREEDIMDEFSQTCLVHSAFSSLYLHGGRIINK